MEEVKQRSQEKFEKFMAEREEEMRCYLLLAFLMYPEGGSPKTISITLAQLVDLIKTTGRGAFVRGYLGAYQDQKMETTS